MPIHVTTSTTQSLSNKTFVDRVSTTGIVYANGGTSDQWNSVYSTVQTSSGSWVSKVAQVVTVQDTTPKSTTATALITDAVPVLSNFSIYNELSATITPTDASSTLIFDIQLPTFQNTISLAVYSLFNNIAGNSLALATIGQHNAANYFVQTRLRYIVPAGSTSPQSFYLGFARTTGSTATVRINDGATPYWGNTQRSTMTITEIRP